MTERPILFSAPMVRAILAGGKTQTRRTISMIEPVARAYSFDRMEGKRALFSLTGKPPMIPHPTDLGKNIRALWPPTVGRNCPYGVPGDRLWVRETFGIADENGRLLDPCLNYRADGAQRPLEDRLDLGWGIAGNQYSGTSDELMSIKDGWRSPIFMPRWASRILLEVTGVRVQRLNEISQEDAIAEGIKVCDRTSLGKPPCFVWPGHGMDKAGLCHTSAATAYAMGWDSINGKKHPWEENCWVWVVSFRRVS